MSPRSAREIRSQAEHRNQQSTGWVDASAGCPIASITRMEEPRVLTGLETPVMETKGEGRDGEGVAGGEVFVRCRAL